MLWETHKVAIASIAVDNAARGVARDVAAHYASRFHIIVNRDPSHDVDLLSKDLATVDVFVEVIEDAKEVYNFVRNDRIDSIKREAVEEGDLDEAYATFSVVDTQMNLLDLFLKSIIKQHKFLLTLGLDPKWHQFLSERKSSAEKLRWEANLYQCSDRTR